MLNVARRLLCLACFNLESRTKPIMFKPKPYYRLNVGMVVINNLGQVLWARRSDGLGWQFPQGGIDAGETPIEAMFRELYEETGLKSQQVKVLGETKKWIKYRIPPRLSRRKFFGVLVGQTQKWFLLQLLAENEAINLALDKKPEFDSWQWVSYYYPIHQAMKFKKRAYRTMLSELAQYQPSLLPSIASQARTC